MAKRTKVTDHYWVITDKYGTSRITEADDAFRPEDIYRRPGETDNDFAARAAARCRVLEASREARLEALAQVRASEAKASEIFERVYRIDEECERLWARVYTAENFTQREEYRAQALRHSYAAMDIKDTLSAIELRDYETYKAKRAR